MENIIEMKDIYKSFGPVQVLTGIDFSLKKGEVRALLGANGAGKSTLMKILSGAHSQTKGEIYLKGEKVNFKNTQEAKEHGISIIYQELSLIPTLTVVQNIFLGREVSGKGMILNEKAMKKEYKEICDEFEFDIDPDCLVSKLSHAKRQMVEIMKAVACDADIIIMDEPSTSLTHTEKEGLFRIINKLKSLGKSIIYISHLLDEIFLVCDTASIMRNGVMVGSYSVKDLTKQKISELMTGTTGKVFTEKNACYADYASAPALEVKNLTRGNEIKNVSFKVHKGEVVGLAGLVGSKRTEIINLIFGVDKKDSGKIFINGKEITIKSPKQAIANGIGFIPEDRKNQGLILDQEVYKNSTAIQIDKFKSKGFLDKKKEKEFADYGVKKLGIKVNNTVQKTKELSGGNQQKVVVSKWLGQNMNLIIYDEPTKGIDIAAKEDIFDTVEEFSKQGIGVIFISSDLEEVLRVSDTILVIRDGEIIGQLKNEGVTVQTLMDKIFDVSRG